MEPRRSISRWIPGASFRLLDDWAVMAACMVCMAPLDAEIFPLVRHNRTMHRQLIDGDSPSFAFQNGFYVDDWSFSGNSLRP
jgi:hypothetical protein